VLAVRERDRVGSEQVGRSLGMDWGNAISAQCASEMLRYLQYYRHILKLDVHHDQTPRHLPMIRREDAAQANLMADTSTLRDPMRSVLK